MKTKDWQHLYIPKGSILVIANPEWDGDDETTQYDIRIRFEEDVFCCTEGGNYEYTILEKVE